MRLILSAATVAALMVSAWSWEPPDRQPGWFLELCAEGLVECEVAGRR